METTARYAHLAQDTVRDTAVRVSDSIAADILSGYGGGDDADARGKTERDGIDP